MKLRQNQRPAAASISSEQETYANWSHDNQEATVSTVGFYSIHTNLIPTNPEDLAPMIADIQSSYKGESIQRTLVRITDTKSTMMAAAAMDMTVITKPALVVNMNVIAFLFLYLILFCYLF